MWEAGTLVGRIEATLQAYPSFLCYRNQLVKTTTKFP